MLYCTISLGQWTPPYSPQGLSAPVQTSMNEGESGNVLLPFILLSSWLAVLWEEGDSVETDRGERKRGCCCTIARDGFAAAAAGKALLFFLPERNLTGAHISFLASKVRLLLFAATHS